MIVDPLPVAWTFEAIGTHWRIDTQDALPPPIADAVTERVARFDRDWSRFRADSRIAALAIPGRHRLADDAGPLLEFYSELYAATAGRVTPLVGRTLEALGYDATYRLRPTGDIPPVPAWEDAVAWDGVFLDVVRPVVLDVGAAGKGYLVDLVSDLLTDAGVAEHIVDASGDLRTQGVSMRIALEHPLDPRKAIGVAELPTRGVLATWVLARTALVADGIATALFFDADPEFVARQATAFARMFDDGSVDVSSDFPGEMFV
jgi:thiamine biosynthesis lipoprotein